ARGRGDVYMRQVFGELYNYNGEWKFNAIGAGYQGGLAALCGSFGVDVE
ncbi:MAG: TerD family protein, partial [Ruminococcus sp.]|nr:TerD family protein [Ruminococcus sp.]